MKNKTLHSCRPAAWALAVGACLLLLGAPARAQWLVQDEKLYKLVKEGIVDKIATSGDGKGSFKAAPRSSKDTQKKEENFEELAFDTEKLLSKEKEDDAEELRRKMEVLARGGRTGSLASDTASKAGTGVSTYSNDATGFFGSSLPGCNHHSNKEVFVQCMHMRNILGSQLKEIQAISKNLEGRNQALQSIMSKGFKTTGELQKKQYQISVLQTVIANDQMRLQTALASYQTMRDLYKEKYNEALRKREYGSGSGSVSDKLAQARAGIAGAATFAATKAAVDSTMNANIFKKR